MVAKVPQSSSGMGDIVSGGLVAGNISLCANGFKAFGDSMSFPGFPVGSKGITSNSIGLCIVVRCWLPIGIAWYRYPVGVLIVWLVFTYLTNMFVQMVVLQLNWQWLFGNPVRFIGAGAIGIAVRF